MATAPAPVRASTRHTRPAHRSETKRLPPASTARPDGQNWADSRAAVSHGELLDTSGFNEVAEEAPTLASVSKEWVTRSTAITDPVFAAATKATFVPSGETDDADRVDDLGYRLKPSTVLAQHVQGTGASIGNVQVAGAVQCDTLELDERNVLLRRPAACDASNDARLAAVGPGDAAAKIVRGVLRIGDIDRPVRTDGNSAPCK